MLSQHIYIYIYYTTCMYYYILLYYVYIIIGSVLTFLEASVSPLLMLLRKTPLQGAYSSIYTLISNDLDSIGGKYIIHCEVVQPSKAAKDENAALKLWEISAKLTGI